MTFSPRLHTITAVISVLRCDRGHKFRRRNLHGACWAGKALNDGDLIASLSPPRPLEQADLGVFGPNRRGSARARVAVHGLNASTAMLDDDKQAPSVAAWKNEQLVLAPFAGNQGSRLRHGAGSAADIERFWRVDHRHGRMLTLATGRGLSTPEPLGERPSASVGQFLGSNLRLTT